MVTFFAYSINHTSSHLTPFAHGFTNGLMKERPFKILIKIFGGHIIFQTSLTHYVKFQPKFLCPKIFHQCEDKRQGQKPTTKVVGYAC
jgi:hypothetical protein